MNFAGSTPVKNRCDCLIYSYIQSCSEAQSHEIPPFAFKNSFGRRPPSPSTLWQRKSFEALDAPPMYSKATAYNRSALAWEILVILTYGSHDPLASSITRYDD